MIRRLASCLLASISGLVPTLCLAQSEIAGPEAFEGSIDLRASVVGGEAGWIDHGFGKLREGGATDRDTKLCTRASPPSISQEHSGSHWGVTDTITPSAANSWVGEEVKVIAIEPAIEHRVGQHRVKLTGGLFRQNDTSGTLLSCRGWALHDLRATIHTELPLPRSAR